MRLYDHPASANCMKVRILLRQLGLACELVRVDLFRGEARGPAHLVRNPDGRVPVLELDSGEHLPESAAILLHLAEGTPLLPPPGLARSRVHQWLFFEQNQIEANVAVGRFLRVTGLGDATPGVTDWLTARGGRAVASLRRGLADGRPFVCGDAYTVADIALYAYVHCAGDAGVDLGRHPAVEAWLRRVETTDGFVNDLEPIPLDRRPAR